MQTKADPTLKGCGVFIAWDDGECQTFITRTFIYRCRIGWSWILWY